MIPWCWLLVAFAAGGLLLKWHDEKECYECYGDFENDFLPS